MSETFLGVIGMNLSTHNLLHLSSLFFAKRSNKHFTPRFLYSLTIYPPRSNNIIRELCPQKWTFGHTKTDTYRFKEQFHRFETVMPETRYVDDVSH